MRIILVPALLLAVGLQAGCGSSNTTAPASAVPVTHVYDPAAGRVPACAHAQKAIVLPAKFPHQFPFPTGTVIVSSGGTRVKGQIAIYGFTPSTSFASTVNFFKRQVPRAGFKVLHFEVDSPNDSEGTYRGHGAIGNWAVRSIPGCKAMRFAASAQSSR